MNKYSLSFDVSTTNVGIALFDSENGDLIELKHLKLNVDRKIPTEDRYIYKTDMFISYIKNYKKTIEEKLNGEIVDIFIEAPLSNTPKNINTTAMLLAFNGIVSYELYNLFKIIPISISVYNVRKLFCPEFVEIKNKKETLSFPKGWKNKDKKEYIRKKVEFLHPSIDWHYTRNNTIRETSHDMSDAYAVGFASFLVKNVLSLYEWKKISDDICKKLT